MDESISSASLAGSGLSSEPFFRFVLFKNRVKVGYYKKPAVLQVLVGEITPFSPDLWVKVEIQ